MPRPIKRPELSSPILIRTATLRFEEHEHAFLKSLAHEHHLSFSGLIRRICLNYPIPPQRTPQLDAEAVRALNRIGSNLNQVAHSLNRIESQLGPAKNVTSRNWKVVLSTLQLQLHSIIERLQ